MMFLITTSKELGEVAIKVAHIVSISRGVELEDNNSVIRLVNGDQLTVSMHFEDIIEHLHSA